MPKRRKSVRPVTAAKEESKQMDNKVGHGAKSQTRDEDREAKKMKKPAKGSQLDKLMATRAILKDV